MSRYKYLIFFLIIALQLPLTAQRGTWRSPFKPIEGKKTSYYARMAKQAQKQQNLAVALINAAKCLNGEPKKNQIKTTVEVLNSSYDKYISNTADQIATLKTASAAIETDADVNERYAIFKHYTELQTLQDLLKKVPSGNFYPKKGAAFSFDFIDYTANRKTAEDSFEAGKVAMTDKYYQIGHALFQKARTVDDFRNTGKALKKVQSYNAKYKDTPQLMATAKEKGTTRMIIHSFDLTQSSMVNVLTNVPTEDAIYHTSMDAMGKNYEYFDLYPAANSGIYIYQNDLARYNKDRNATALAREKDKQFHYRLVSKYIAYDFQEAIVPIETVYAEDEVVIRTIKTKDGEGKEIKKEIKGIVRANVNIHTKKAKIVLQSEVKTQSVASGKVLKTEVFTTEHWYEYKWATFQGDKRALNSYQSSLAQQSPQRKLDVQTAFKETANIHGKDIALKMILPVARKKG